MLSSQHCTPTPAGLYLESRGQECQGSLPPHSHSVLTGKSPECGGLGPRTTPSLANPPPRGLPRGSQGPASRIPEPKAPRRERGSSSGRFRKIPSPQTLPAPAPVACCALSNLTWLCREHRQVPVERTPAGSWPTATEQRRDRLGPGRRAGRWQHPPPSHTHHPQVTREGESTQHLPNTGPFSVVTSTGQREGRESLESPNKRLKTESP